MATFAKTLSFIEDCLKKVHNLSSDQLVVALTNTAPNTAWTKLSDLTEIAYTNLSSRNITTTSLLSSAGTATLALADLTLTASGVVGPFRYVYIYNDTATNKELIGYIDYGSAITMASGETFLIDFNAATITAS